METKDYLPEVHGTIRAKYEYQTTMGAGRFEVRNARVSVTGNVLPSVAYKAEIDLSDEGQIKMLDAYARLFPTKGLTVTAGQMRVPFTIDAHRSPHQQYFPNRSFIAKQVGNVRDVGFTVGYTLPTDVPITVEGGLFNGSGLTNQKEWHKEVNYSAKAQFLFTKGLNLALSVQSIQPEEVRMQSYDIGAYYERPFPYRRRIFVQAIFRQRFQRCTRRQHFHQLRPAATKSIQPNVFPATLRHDDRPERRQNHR